LKERSLNLPMSLMSAAVKLDAVVVPALDDDLPPEPQPAATRASAPRTSPGRK
jgi:hypothetical protein